MNALLKDVSRSFYLSIRVLPAPMRGAVATAYLLARASDTLADAGAVPVADRLACLDGLVEELDAGRGRWHAPIAALARLVEHPGERQLLMDLEQVFQLWRRLPAAERGHVRDVVGTIVSGQRLDVQRAHQGDFPLQDEAELEDYCHRVAGCVGSFWTRIGMLTLGERFSKSDAAVLEEQGETFGRGLQLINILRDLAADLRQGRCYLPVKPTPKAILEEAARWRSVARDRMACGLEYAAAMRTRRLRLAVALPALLGLRTLDLLDGADWRSLEAGVKVSRAQVRRCALQAWFGGAELLSFGRTSAGGH